MNINWATIAALVALAAIGIIAVVLMWREHRIAVARRDWTP